ncbi:MAG: hypothetical protein AB8B57_02335 [Congregibacter sp.]
MKLRRRGFNLLAALAALPIPGKADPALALMEVSATLDLAAWHLFPHASLTDAHYRAVTQSFMSINEPQAQRLASVLGVRRFLAMAEEQRDDALRAVELSADFQTFRMHVLMQLYSDPSIIRGFGYQGPSLDQGGYLERGFNDISWLPESK